MSQMAPQSKLLEKRVIFLTEEVCAESMSELIQMLILLGGSDEPITLVINTCGGEIQSGLALIDVLRALPCPIKTVSLGVAASMGAVILAAGTKGMRYISKNSRVFLHQPLMIGDGLPQSYSAVIRSARNISEQKEIIDGMIAEFSGKEISIVKEETSFDNNMVAEKAIELGIVDKMVDGKELYEILKGSETV